MAVRVDTDPTARTLLIHFTPEQVEHLLHLLDLVPCGRANRLVAANLRRALRDQERTP
jgi:hypothetical protein